MEEEGKMSEPLEQLECNSNDDSLSDTTDEEEPLSDTTDDEAGHEDVTTRPDEKRPRIEQNDDSSSGYSDSD